MNEQRSKILFVLGAVVGLWMLNGQSAGPVNPVPVPTTTLDLSAALTPSREITTAQRRTDAGELRRIFEVVADRVEWDGTKPDEQQTFKTGAAIDDHIVTVREFYTRGVAYRDLYPQLGPAIGAHLQTRLADSSVGTLSADARRQWVAALREVVAACSKLEGA